MTNKKATALVLVDPHLKNFAHHHFNYDMAIVRAGRSRGMRVRLMIDREATNEVVNALQAEPILTALGFTPLRASLLNALRIGPAFQFLHAVAKRFFELRKHLSPTATGNTIVFVPTCDARNLSAWILWCACQSSASRPAIVLMLRFPCVRTELDPLSGLIREGYALALKYLPLLDPSGRIKLCTDSKLLATQYAELTERHISVLPIPHTEGLASAPAIDLHPRDPLASVVVALGDARLEKGFDILVDAIIRVASSSLGREFVFVLHCPVHPAHRDMQCHVDRLRKLALGNVRLIQAFLAEAEYYALLNSAEIVLMPYRQKSYTSKTSGPLIEAMAAAKIVIATDQTWLSEMITAYGGGLTFVDGDAESLAQAIIAAHSDRATLLSKANQGAKAIRAEHNPQNFLDCLVAVAMPRVTRAAPPQADDA